MLKNRFSFFLLLCLSVSVQAQEALKSTEEVYFDFLSLQGLAERPYLNYRTLSDSVWRLDENASHLWHGQNLGIKRNIFGDVFMRVYGPELFSSFNNTTPYGQNDGALWQGRGANASFSGGVRFEGYGAELTIKPQLAFSQNLDFDHLPPVYSYYTELFADKAWIYGYYGLPYIDAPQRFGDEPFFTFDWGDSEIRYTWKTFTLGFGTQTIWLGPAELNPIIHSNNAPSYPKFDFGLRRQPMIIPERDWYIGDIEFRVWFGYLSESDWFDNDSSDDHRMINGFSIAYSFPSLLRGLTIGFNRVMLVSWDAFNAKSIFKLLNPFKIEFDGDDDNQLASIIVSYLLPNAGINIYLEWGRDDFSPHMDYYIRYPFHTQAYTVGVKKSLPITGILAGEILLEFSMLEGSRDYDLLPWDYTLYTHWPLIQGYTNRGQYLGAGIGGGGNSQYLGFKLYFPRGYGGLFLQRRNPDMDYTWYYDARQQPSGYAAERNIRAFMDFGISGMFYFMPNLGVSVSMVFRDEHNPLYESIPGSSLLPTSLHRSNAHFAASVKYSF